MTAPTPSVSEALYALSRGYPLSMSQNAEVVAYIANLQRELADARARATKWYDRYQQQNDNWIAAESALAECFRLAGGDTECRPHPTGEQIVDVVRDLRECYDEFLADWNNRLK